MESNQTKAYQLRKLAEMKDATIENGFRVARIIFKGDETRESQAAMIPIRSDNFVQAFAQSSRGLQLVREYIESLENAVVRKVYVDSGRSPCDADLTIESLCDIGEATSENFRLTKEVINKYFEEGWKNRIAYSLVAERDAVAFATLEASPEEFWNSESGLKYLSIATNYKQYLLRAAERKPSFETAAVKERVLQTVEYLDVDVIVEKMKDKLVNAPVVSVDTTAL